MISDYIGIPYKNKGRAKDGCDCLGLYLLFHPDIHDYNYESSNNSTSIDSTISNSRSEWKKVKPPRYGDLILFTIAGYNTHVGMFIDGMSFIHTLKGHDSAIDRLDSARWKNRIEGFYRYVNS